MIHPLKHRDLGLPDVASCEQRVPFEALRTDLCSQLRSKEFVNRLTKPRRERGTLPHAFSQCHIWKVWLNAEYLHSRFLDPLLSTNIVLRRREEKFRENARNSVIVNLTRSPYQEISSIFMNAMLWSSALELLLSEGIRLYCRGYA